MKQGFYLRVLKAVSRAKDGVTISELCTMFPAELPARVQANLSTLRSEGRVIKLPQHRPSLKRAGQMSSVYAISDSGIQHITNKDKKAAKYKVPKKQIAAKAGVLHAQNDIAAAIKVLSKYGLKVTG